MTKFWYQHFFFSNTLFEKKIIYLLHFHLKAQLMNKNNKQTNKTCTALIAVLLVYRLLWFQFNYANCLIYSKFDKYFHQLISKCGY